MVVGAGIFAYQEIALQLNKRQFEHARVAIDTVYADIVSKVGQPDNFKRENSCSVSYQEFDTGRTSCSIDTSFIFAVKDKNEASSIFKKIQSVVDSDKHYFKISRPPSDSISSSPVAYFYYQEAQDYYYVTGLKCTIKYVYDTPKDTYLSLSTGDGVKTMFIVLGCDGSARSKIYPVAN